MQRNHSVFSTKRAPEQLATTGKLRAQDYSGGGLTMETVVREWKVNASDKQLIPGSLTGDF